MVRVLDDLAGKRTGERIQILRERKGLSRPVLAGLVGMSASWLKGIEQGRRLPPRLPVLVKLAEALAVGDVAVLAGTDMDLGGATSVPVASFARIPHAAVPAIRDAIRDPMLSAPDSPVDVEGLAARTDDAWRLWHTSREHRTEVGRILPRLVTDARAAARSAEGADRRAAQAVLADVCALVQHEIVWASEAELTWTVADRAMTAAQEADTPVALAGAAWTLGMVQRSAGDVDGALSLARDAVALLDHATCVRLFNDMHAAGRHLLVRQQLPPRQATSSPAKPEHASSRSSSAPSRRATSQPWTSPPRTTPGWPNLSTRTVISCWALRTLL